MRVAIRNCLNFRRRDLPFDGVGHFAGVVGAGDLIQFLVFFENVVVLFLLDFEYFFFDQINNKQVFDAFVEFGSFENYFLLNISSSYGLIFLFFL